jgi:hypothetical protein
MKRADIDKIRLKFPGNFKYQAKTFIEMIPNK